MTAMQRRVRRPTGVCGGSTVVGMAGVVNTVNQSETDDTGRDMFEDAVLTSVAEARLRLAAAVATTDSQALAEALDELEEALAVARGCGMMSSLSLFRERPRRR